jgi:acyl-CoA thioesterase
MNPPEAYGVQYLRRLNLMKPTTGMWANLGLSIVQVEAGSAVVEGHVSHNAHGSSAGARTVVHRGVLAAIGDCAMACAGSTIMSEGEAATTVGLTVQYLKPAVAGTVVARAEVRGRSGQMVFCHAIVEQAGEAVAECTGTIALVPA